MHMHMYVICVCTLTSGARAVTRTHTYTYAYICICYIYVHSPQVRETAISKTPRGITPVRPAMQMTGLRVVNQPS